jgi:hypothetical protein
MCQKIIEELNKYSFSDSTLIATGSWGIQTRTNSSDYDCFSILETKKTNLYNQINIFSKSQTISSFNFDKKFFSPLNRKSYFTFSELQKKIKSSRSITNKITLYIIILKGRVIAGDKGLLIKLKNEILKNPIMSKDLIVYSIFRLIKQCFFSFTDGKQTSINKTLKDFIYLETVLLKDTSLILKDWNMHQEIYIESEKVIKSSPQFSTNPTFFESLKFLISKI